MAKTPGTDSGCIGGVIMLLGILFLIGRLYQYLRSGYMKFYTLADVVWGLDENFHGWPGLQSICEKIPLFLALIVLGFFIMALSD